MCVHVCSHVQQKYQPPLNMYVAYIRVTFITTEIGVYMHTYLQHLQVTVTTRTDMVMATDYACSPHSGVASFSPDILIPTAYSDSLILISKGAGFYRYRVFTDKYMCIVMCIERQ